MMMTTRRCAGRDSLVRSGTDPPAGNSRLCRARQTSSSRTARPAHCRHGRNSQKSSPPGSSRGRGWNSGVGHRKHSLHRLVSRARTACNDQHDLAWGSTKRRVVLSRVGCVERAPRPLLLTLILIFSDEPVPKGAPSLRVLCARVGFKRGVPLGLASAYSVIVPSVFKSRSNFSSPTA